MNRALEERKERPALEGLFVSEDRQLELAPSDSGGVFRELRDYVSYLLLPHGQVVRQTRAGELRGSVEADGTWLKVRYEDGEREAFEIVDAGHLRRGATPLVRVARHRDLRLDGRYASDREAVTFTRDGAFFTDLACGRYTITGNTLALLYDHGALEATTFYVAPGSEPQRSEIVIDGRAYTHLPL